MTAVPDRARSPADFKKFLRSPEKFEFCLVDVVLISLNGFSGFLLLGRQQRRHTLFQFEKKPWI